MKANAPERIWIDNLDEGFWFDSPSGKKSIEYTRTDVFIEKAVEWLECNNTLPDGEVSDYIEEFTKAMKL